MRSRSLGPDDRIPDMAMDEAKVLFKDHFQIFSQVSPGRQYAVRFIAAPYTSDEAHSILVHGHGRNPERLSAVSIIALLAKFGETEERFKAEYNRFYDEASKAKGTDR